MTLTFDAVDGIGEVAEGDDIAALILAATDLADGDVVVVTSKIVSKSAGLTTTKTKDQLLDAETDRIVAQRGQTRIVRTHQGLTMAAAGIDASNTAPGTLIPLPPDPDTSAAQIRATIAELTGVRVAIIISDTAGRAWRIGQTDIAVGCAGLIPYESFAGRTDPYGNPLAVTAPAIADEIAGAAELASGKFGAKPIVIVRGTDPAWHTHDDGPGARALIRDEDSDMFGLGAREAAVAAAIGERPVRGLPSDEHTTLEEIVTLALRGLQVARSDVAIDGTTVVVSIRAGSEVGGGVLVQRLVSLGIAHGVAIGVRLVTVADD